jgi:hypothetical protein
VFGRFTHTLFALHGHCLYKKLGAIFFEALSVHIKQRVREQPDTGILEKSGPGFGSLPDFGMAEENGGMG